MATGIDPRDFGRLEQAVEHLSGNVAALTIALNDAVKSLSARLSALEDRWKFGRGAVIGMILMAALSVYGASEFIDKLLGLVAK